MSRAYRIKVSETVTRVVHVEDGIEGPVDLLGILPPEDMNELLRQQLQTDGFERQEDGSMVKKLDEVIIEISPQERRIKASVDQEEEVTAKVKLDGTSYQETRRQAKKDLSTEAQAQAEAQINEERERLQRTVTDQLTGGIQNIQNELDQAINRTTAEALKRRAAQLGEIEEISEDNETGSLQIRVKVP
jgi:hypothetical protein